MRYIKYRVNELVYADPLHEVSMRSFLPCSRRFFASALLCVCSAASAQSYPAKPLEWVVPYPAGGGTDVVARTLAEAMGKTLGQSIIINNKPGAATNIGAEYVARSKADGYVLMSADTATLASDATILRTLHTPSLEGAAPLLRPVAATPRTRNPGPLSHALARYRASWNRGAAPDDQFPHRYRRLAPRAGGRQGPRRPPVRRSGAPCGPPRPAGAGPVRRRPDGWPLTD